MAIFILTIIFFLLFSAIDAVNYAANGTIYCRNETMHKVRVELWEWDTLFDDDLGIGAKTMTDKNGQFYVSGGAYEFFDEQPYLWIVHQCSKDEIKKGCPPIESRLYFKGDFRDFGPNEYLFQVKVNLIENTAEVDGKIYELETTKC